jgi:hypothetical protein
MIEKLCFFHINNRLFKMIFILQEKWNENSPSSLENVHKIFKWSGTMQMVLQT